MLSRLTYIIPYTCPRPLLLHRFFIPASTFSACLLPSNLQMRGHKAHLHLLPSLLLPPFPHLTRLPHCLPGGSHSCLWLHLTGTCWCPVASLSLALSPEFWLGWAPACRHVLEFSSFFLKRAHLVSPILVDDMCLRIHSVWLCLPSSLCSLYSLSHQVSPLELGCHLTRSHPVFCWYLIWCLVRAHQLRHEASWPVPQSSVSTQLVHHLYGCLCRHQIA